MEKAQGTDPRRPALARCLKALQPGDTLIVWKLDRLGRSVRNVLNILHDLDAQGVQFKSLTEAIDTSTPIGRAMVHMAALLAELERGLIVERTRAGVKVAQARGVKFGRKPKLTADQIEHAADQIDHHGRSVAEMAGLYNVARTTLWRALSKA
jgi:DNA invertase Pin-like site-specific DNA recombinase